MLKNFKINNTKEITINNTEEIVNKLEKHYPNLTKKELIEFVELSIALNIYIYDDYDNDSIIDDILFDFYTYHDSTKGNVVWAIDSRGSIIAYFTETEKVKILTYADAEEFCENELLFFTYENQESLKKVNQLSIHKKIKLAKQTRDCYLDILVHDSDWLVRRIVAWHGRDKDLDILVHDDNYSVREVVAIHGRDKDLNILVRDNNVAVRCAVAEHGRDKDLDILVHDDNSEVRYEVAKHGRDCDLNILAYDEDEYVRSKVEQYNKNKNLDIKDN